ncbi:hypothetical protein ACOZ4I_06915 [Haloarcula salina]|uniref:hypothetical protein n=1 Tax=Haloarcula salina TaxID=1429914 RepID=UPI003C6EC851
MQLVEGVVALLAIVLYLLALAALGLGILFGFAAAIGLVGAVPTIPLLYVLPDVRRFLALASGGGPADETPPWRVALRLRYLLLSMAGGVAYGTVFLLLFIPVQELGLLHAAVGPVPVWFAIPLGFVGFVAPLAYVAHRNSRAWTETTDARSVFLQWLVFATVVVAVETAVPVLVTRL